MVGKQQEQYAICAAFCLRNILFIRDDHETPNIYGKLICNWAPVVTLVVAVAADLLQ